MFMHIETRPDAHPELGKRRNEEAANIIHIRRTLVMEVIAKIAHLRNPEYNGRMRPLLMTVGEQHARLQGGKMSRAIVALISMCDATGENGSSLLLEAAARGGRGIVEDDLELESVIDEEEEREDEEDYDDFDDERVEGEDVDEDLDGEDLDGSKEDTPSVSSDDRDYREAPDLETPTKGGGGGGEFLFLTILIFIYFFFFIFFDLLTLTYFFFWFCYGFSQVEEERVGEEVRVMGVESWRRVAVAAVLRLAARRRRSRRRRSVGTRWRRRDSRGSHATRRRGVAKTSRTLMMTSCVKF
jgi:hypothetical protein